MQCQELEIIVKAKKHFRTRIMANNNKKDVNSTNWKQDWWFCNNISFADVVKSNVKMSQMVDSGQSMTVTNKAGHSTSQCINIVGKNIGGNCSKTSHQNMSNMY